MKEFVKKHGDENTTTATVEGAEEYTVWQSLDCQFTVVDTVEFEACKKDANVDVTIFGKFNHRCDAEEYARWLHSGKTANKEFSIDDFKKSVTGEAVRVLKSMITAAKPHYVSMGKNMARNEFMEQLGLNKFYMPKYGYDPFDEDAWIEAMKDSIGKLFNS